MKYLGIKCGRIVEGFAILPSIDVLWMTLIVGRFYDVQFSWLWWYVTIGTINKKLKNDNIDLI